MQKDYNKKREMHKCLSRVKSDSRFDRSHAFSQQTCYRAFGVLLVTGFAFKLLAYEIDWSLFEAK